MSSFHDHVFPALLAASLLGLGGCQVPSREAKADLLLPTRFAGAPSAPASVPAALPDRWWLALPDPELHRLIAEALEGNFGLAATWERLAQRAAIARRDGAGLWPSLNATAGVTRERQVTEGGTGEQTSTFGTDYDVGLTATYELDLWREVRSLRAAVAWEAKASQEDLAAAAISLSAEVANTWYQLVEQYGQLDLLEFQRETNDTVLKLVKVRFRSAKASAADVLRQQQLIESSRGAIAAAEAQAAVLEHALAILVGRPPGSRVALRRTSFVDLPPVPTTGLPAELLERRPDVRSAFYNLLAADERGVTAQAARLPQITLTASLKDSDQNLSQLLDDWVGTLAGDLVMPLLSGGRREAEAARAEAVARERLQTYRQTVLTALGEVENALVQESRQTVLIDSLEKQLSFSKGALLRTRDSYNKGAVDYLRVLDALLSQQSIERNILTARRTLVTQRIALYRALSGGWNLRETPSASVDPTLVTALSN